MSKRYDFWITEEQNQILEERTDQAGFRKKSDYIRFILFTDVNFIDKINKIYEKVCGKNGS